MLITKQNGEKELFNPKSLKGSLARSGANDSELEQVYELVTQDIYDGIGTKELYGRAFTALKKIRNSFAARYSLKAAIADLGPEGFFFEKWMAKIFQKQGFDAITSQTLPGEAVSHEIDIVASKHDELLLCECKFRNDHESKISVPVAMAFLSRYNDLKAKTFSFFAKELKPTAGVLITNAYFTTDSITFAEHYDLQLISWNYPPENNLKSFADRLGMYPITSLTTIDDEKKKMLLNKNCLLVKEIVDNPVLLEHFNFSEELQNEILDEARELCEYVVNKD